MPTASCSKCRPSWCPTPRAARRARMPSRSRATSPGWPRPMRCRPRCGCTSGCSPRRNPGSGELLDELNPDSLQVCTAYVEPSLADAHGRPALPVRAPRLLRAGPKAAARRPAGVQPRGGHARQLGQVSPSKAILPSANHVHRALPSRAGERPSSVRWRFLRLPSWGAKPARQPVASRHRTSGRMRFQVPGGIARFSLGPAPSDPSRMPATCRCW